MPDHGAADKAGSVCSAVGVRTMAEPARLGELGASPFHGAGRRLWGTVAWGPWPIEAAITSAGM